MGGHGSPSKSPVENCFLLASKANQRSGKQPPGMSNHAIGASHNTDWPGSTKTCLRTLIGSKNGACNPMNTPSASQWLWSHLPHSIQWFAIHSSDRTTLLRGSFSKLSCTNEYQGYEDHNKERNENLMRRIWRRWTIKTKRRTQYDWYWSTVARSQ